MKKISILVLALAFIVNARASNADLFSYDLSEINTELSDLEVVENVIIQNQNSTIYEINRKIINNNFLSSSFNTNYKSSLFARNAFTMEDVDWGAFAWGLLCCPVGFFVVVTNKDKEKSQKSSFFIGWATAVIVELITIAALY